MLRAILKLLLKLLYRVELNGSTEVFRAPRLLVVANHQSLLDGLLLGLFLPVDATFVVHSGVMHNPVYRFFLSLTNYIAVDPMNPMGIKTIVKLVESGKPVVIFPEGRITTTGSLMKTYDGPAFVAARTNAYVVPVHIDGASQSPFGYLSKLYPVRWFPKIRLTVTQPTYIARTDGKAKDARKAAGVALQRVLQESLVVARGLQAHTLFDAFLQARRLFGSDYAFASDVKTSDKTYGELLKMSMGIARLAGRRTERAEHVGVLLPNSVGTLAVLLGLSASGRIPCMLNYTAGADGMSAACVAAGIRTIITSAEFIDKAKLAPVIGGLAASCNVLYTEDLKADIRPSDKAWIACATLFPTAFVARVDSSDSALILFTSGSEGKPKGVVHSHASILANVNQIRASADFTPHDKFFTALPLFHSFGLTAGALLPLFAGCKVFLYPSPLHYRIIPELVYDTGATILAGTSTFLGNYARFAHPYDFAKLRYVIAGAEKLSEAVRTGYFEKFGVRVLEGYGVTECAPVIAVNTLMGYKTGTVGKILPGIQWCLDPVPGVSTGGRLCVFGPNVMKGYLLYDNPRALQPPKALGREGWYDTGDIVEIDSDGFVRIVGRAKRFAKIAGEMISLDVCESLSSKASPASMHAVVVRPDAHKGEAVVLFTTDRNLTKQQLLRAAQLHGSPELAVPRDIRHLEQIPVLGSGKTDYVRLAAEARLNVPVEVEADDEEDDA